LAKDRNPKEPPITDFTERAEAAQREEAAVVAKKEEEEEEEVVRVLLSRLRALMATRRRKGRKTKISLETYMILIILIIF